MTQASLKISKVFAFIATADDGKQVTAFVTPEMAVTFGACVRDGRPAVLEIKGCGSVIIDDQRNVLVMNHAPNEKMRDFVDSVSIDLSVVESVFHEGNPK